MAAARAGRCFLCDLPAAAVAWRENGYDAVACGCGLAFVQPPPSDGTVDPRYDAHSADFYRLPARRKVAWLSSQRKPGRLLEVGCGDGWFLDAARAARFEAHGIDADAGRVATAAGRGLRVRHGLLEDLTTDERYDVVFHCDLLSHFPEPLAALRKMAGLTTPGGALFFEVGLLGAPMRDWYPRIGGIGLPQHRWLYSEGALATLLARAGLRVVAQRRFGLGAAVMAGAAIRRVARSAHTLLRRSPAASAPAPSSAALPPVARQPSWRTQLTRMGERFDNFVRYEVGAWTPHYGPATLLVLAQREAAP